jgi:uncharacterized damage-inducible protein DinB
MIRQLIQSLVSYHVSMNNRILALLDEASEAAFLEQGSFAHGSLRSLLVHLASTDLRWLAGLQGSADAGHLDAGRYPDRAAVKKLVLQAGEQLLAYVSSLQEADLKEFLTPVRATHWQVLLQLVNHGTDHRATLLQVLKDKGIRTFDQDYILWTWQAG